MRIILDIGHPGQVHLFRPFAKIMKSNGHKIVFTCREKEFEKELLKAADLDYYCLGKHYKSLIGKIWGLFRFNLHLLIIANQVKPDLFLSAGSIYASHVAWLMRKPHISMEDTGNMEQVRLYLPFTSVVLTPEVLSKNLGNKQLRYSGYHELAYLHPNHFTPDDNIHEILSIAKSEKFYLLRFVAWNATHDKGQCGLSDQDKIDIVELLLLHGKVFISAEGTLPEYLKKYRISIAPDKLHDVIRVAQIVVSEGATIASEAGILGTPSIYVNSMEACNNYDQEKYGTLSNFKNGVGVVDRIITLLDKNEKRSTLQNKIIEDKIDVTAFLVWFVENYPKSEVIFRNNPEYQFKFQ